jgi:hypothetical protein
MAEMGAVRLAQVVPDVAEAAVPQYRGPFSKHTFTQPSLLAILCLMRYEDWTYREAAVRLREHAELGEVLGIGRVPDYTTLYRCLRSIAEEELARLLRETIRQMPPPPTDGGTGEAPPQPSPHRQHEEHLTGWRPGRPQPLGLLRLAGHPRPALRSQRQTAGQRQRRPGHQPVVQLLIGEAPQRAQRCQEQQRLLAIDARRPARTGGQRRGHSSWARWTATRHSASNSKRRTSVSAATCSASAIVR